MNIKTSPSLLAADFLHLEEEVRRAEDAGADMLHCDIMDGIYVPNISFGFPVVKQIGKITRLPLDVHMMTAAPENYIETLKEIGAASITIHTDVLPQDQLITCLQDIHAKGMKAAVALKPANPAEDAYALVPFCDMILIMTVEPGFGGQKFMSDMLPKIRTLRSYIERHGSDCDIQVDGGIGKTTIADCAEAGANVFVVGTASFGADNMKEALEELTNLAALSSAED